MSWRQTDGSDDDFDDLLDRMKDTQMTQCFNRTIEEATYHPVLWVTMTCKRRNKGLLTFGDMQTVKMGGYTQQLQVYTHRCAVMGWWVNKSLKPERDWSRGGGLPKLRATLTQQLHERHVTIMSTATMTSCQLHSS